MLSIWYLKLYRKEKINLSPFSWHSIMVLRVSGIYRTKGFHMKIIFSYALIFLFVLTACSDFGFLCKYWILTSVENEPTNSFGMVPTDTESLMNPPLIHMHNITKWVEEPVTWTPPPLEPIVPVSGNRLKTQRFAWFWT